MEPADNSIGNNNQVPNDQADGGEILLGNGQPRDNQLVNNGTGIKQPVIVAAKKVAESSEETVYRRVLHILKQILTPPKGFWKRFIYFTVGCVETAIGAVLTIGLLPFNVANLHRLIREGLHANGHWLVHEGVHDIEKSLINNVDQLTLRNWLASKGIPYARHMFGEVVLLLFRIILGAFHR